MITITLCNAKGGTAKTTTALCMAAGLAEKGYKVLAVDTDRQCNLTYAAGITPQEAEITLLSLIGGEIPTEDAIKPCGAGFDVIPGENHPQINRLEGNSVIKGILEPIKENYDYCIIDSPPALEMITLNDLVASDHIIIPMNADIFSLQGLTEIQELISYVQENFNPGLKLEGLLLTRFNPRTIINRNIQEGLDSIADQLHTKVYSTTIREAIVVKEMQFNQGNLFTDHPRAKVTADYRAFIDEYLKGVK
jgi:chromosome partitioning protein